MAGLESKPLTDTLGELEAGEFLRDATTALRKVTAAVRETRKPGTVTITLGLAPSGRGSIEIDQPDVVEDQAFDELTSAIAADTGITPYLGVA